LTTLAGSGGACGWYNIYGWGGTDTADTYYWTDSALFTAASAFAATALVGLVL